MLDVLSDGFRQAKLKLKGKAVLNEENLSAALDDVRRSLLEADVEYDVAKGFLADVKAQVLGQTVQVRAGSGDNRIKVTPADHFIQICQEELEKLMGPASSDLTFAHSRPTTVMMVGLQGSGKTTTTAKLCKHLMTKHKRKPLLVAADIYRPAAIDQLKILGARLGVPVFSLDGAKPPEICQRAIVKAQELGCDTILFDTAGRLTIDSELMDELKAIKSIARPDNILLVCDAMMGQDAVTTAKAFNDLLDLSGFVITKLDGDSRGGAALSIKRVTGKPIKFLGMGEDLDRLEEFRPEGLASRILGMGDVVGLMKDFERVSEKDQEEEALKMLQGQFSFKDFYDQIAMIQKMGSLKDIIAKLPMQDMIPKDLVVDDKELLKIKAMIDSMTEKERVNPNLLNDSRCRRVARGSGRGPKEVTELVGRFKKMRTMMAGLGKSMGLMGKIPGMGQLNQLNQLRKMAQNMGGAGGGMPGFGGMGGMGGAMPPGMAGMFGGMGGGGGAMKRPEDKDKLKKMRKAAKAARKKNR